MARRAFAAAAAMVVVVSLLSTSMASAAQNVTPAHAGGSKGKSCPQIAGCVRCTAGKGGGHNKAPQPATCLACTTDGPIAPVLDAGRCFCPAGSARVGTTGTVPIVTSNGASTSKKGGGKKPPSVKASACAECAADFFAAATQPVGTSACVPCPTGTTTNGATGATACVPAFACGPVGAPCGDQATCNASDECSCAPGFWATNQAPSPVCSPCTAQSYCLGGPVTNAGRTPCPTNTYSSVGSASLSDCSVGPGTYWAGSAVQLCNSGSYCLGGSVTGAGLVQTPCPLGTDTACVTGATSSTQCVVSPIDPCGGAVNPKTYFTTSPASGGAANAIYVAQALDPGTTTPPPYASLVCTFPTTTPEFADAAASVDDIAATSQGRLLITGRPTASFASGFMLLVDPSVQTGQTCTYTKLIDVTPAIFGLSSGFKSNVLHTTGGLHLVTYEISEAAGVVSLVPLKTMLISTAIGGPVDLASDITIWPDNQAIYFTNLESGFIAMLDADGLPDGQITLTGTGNIGASAPAAWCNSLYTFAASSSTDRAYNFGDPAFIDIGPTTMGVTGVSGATAAAACPSP